ncbi:hypothetical protein [Lactobacillus xylocopicola]|uniref:Uncharacterized protein n=1 Tax=Lactobacillus xylocopicola TaxID=2976676 RepID=A0ABN6SL42_9LACO|nr:hypothetical protein [Lactobacillus xylocopicola]BDR60344.1 hypothetical protein KIM322_06050 [Lactobacillus xylocopicola]
MNNDEYETTIKIFFITLSSNEDNQKEFSTFLRNNNSVLTSHPAFMYSKEKQGLDSTYTNLEQFFHKKDAGDNLNSPFTEKMNFIKNNYQDLFYGLEMYTDLIRSNNYIDRINYLDGRKVELFTQQKELEEKQTSLSDDISNQENKIYGQKIIIADQQHDLQKITSKINSIYTEFITILGIFTAITFVIFGGMNLLTDLFKNIGSTPTSLGQTLILAAVFGLMMWGIIELLFYWIIKIKGVTDSTKDKHKHWFNWIALVILATILILGVLLFTHVLK